MAGDISTITLGEVIDHGNASGVSPEGIATAVGNWRNAQADWLKEQKPSDANYFKSIEYLDDESSKALGEIRDGAIRNWRQSKLPEILPDPQQQEWFAEQMQTKPPTPEELGSWQVPEGSDPQAFINAYNDYSKLASDPIYRPSKMADWQGINSGSGAELAKWRAFETPHGTDVQIQIPGHEDGRLTIPKVSDEDYQEALEKARKSANELTAEEDASRMMDVGGMTSRLITGMRQLPVVEREAQEARSKLERLESNPTEGKIEIAKEKLTEALKASPLSDKIGKNDLWEDFTSGLWSGLVQMRIAANDLMGDTEERDAMRNYLHAYNQANPGSTRREFQGGFGNVLRQGASGLGSAIPTIATAAAVTAATGGGGASIAGQLASRALTMAPLAAQSYGGNLDQMLSDADEAERNGNLALAKSLRDNARSAAVAGAITDVGTELIFPEEQVLGKVVGSGSRLARLGKETLKSAGQNFVEEALAQAIQGNVIQPQLQGKEGTLGDTLEAGLAGAIAGAPLGAATSIIHADSHEGVETEVNNDASDTADALIDSPDTKMTGEALKAISNATEDQSPSLSENKPAVLEPPKTYEEEKDAAEQIGQEGQASASEDVNTDVAGIQPLEDADLAGDSPTLVTSPEQLSAAENTPAEQTEPESGGAPADFTFQSSIPLTEEERPVHDAVSAAVSRFLPDWKKVFSGVSFTRNANEIGATGKTGGFALDESGKLHFFLDDIKDSIGSVGNVNKWVLANITEEAIHRVTQTEEEAGRIDSVGLLNQLKAEAPKVYDQFRQSYAARDDKEAAMEFVRMLTQGRIKVTSGGISINGELTEQQFSKGFLRSIADLLQKVIGTIRNLQKKGVSPEFAQQLEVHAARIAGTLDNLIQKSREDNLSVTSQAEMQKAAPGDQPGAANKPAVVTSNAAPATGSSAPAALVEGASNTQEVKSTKSPGITGDFGKENKLYSREGYEDAIKNLASQRTEDSGLSRSQPNKEPLTPQQRRSMLDAAGFLVEGGIRDLPSLTEALVQSGGEYLRPHAKEVFEHLRYVHKDEAWAKEMTEGPQKGGATPPGIKPWEQEALDEGATGTKNAVTDELRKSLGLDAAKELEHESTADVLKEALNRISQDKGYQDRLIESLSNDPRAIDQYEEAALMHANLRAQQDIEAAHKDIADAAAADDPLKRADATQRLQEAKLKAQVLFDIERQAGTTWGRTGRFRQEMLRRDFSMPKMVKDYMLAANKGKALNEDQEKHVAAMSKEIGDLQKQISDLKAKQEKNNLRDLFDSIAGRLDFIRGEAKAAFKKEGDMKAFLSQKAKEALERQSKRNKGEAPASQLSRSQPSDKEYSRIDPDAITDAIVVMANDIAARITAEKAMERLSSAFGKEFTDTHGPDIQEAATRLHDTLAAETNPEAKVRRRKAVARAKGKAKATAEMDAAAGLQKPTQNAVVNAVKAQIEAGAQGHEAVIKGAFDEVKGYFPELTEQEFRQIFTDYGNAKFPSGEYVATQLRLHRRLESLVETRERLKAGQPLLKSGPQRDKATTDERKITREINDLKKKLGYSAPSSEQLAGALDAAKTRLRNQIDELDAAIKKGGRTAEDKAARPGLEYDEEAKALLKQRDDLKKALDKLEGKTPLTMEQRTAITINALKRTEEELSRRIVANEWLKPKTVKDTVTNDEIEERRSLIQSMRDAIKEEAKALQETKSPEQRGIEAAQKQLEYWEGVLDGSVERRKTSPKGPLSEEEAILKGNTLTVRKALEDLLKRPKTDAEKADSERNTAVKSALASMVEYERRAKEKDFSQKGKKEGPEQQEVAKARAMRDAAKAVYDSMRKLETEDMRSEEARRNAYETAKANYEKKTAEGDIGMKGKKANRPETAETQKAREEMEAARAAYHSYLDSRRDEIDLIRQKKNVRSRIDALQDKLDRKDFSKPTKREKAKDSELRDLEVELEMKKEQWFKELFELELKNRSIPRKIVGAIEEVIHTGRLLELGLDFGAVLRQGGTAIMRPKVIGSALSKGLQSMKSEANETALRLELEKHPMREIYKKAGLEISDPGAASLLKQEEAYMSRLINKWPKKLGGGIVRGTGRGQVTFLNWLRINMMDAMSATLSKFGEPSVKELEHFAAYINAATGRASLTDAEKSASRLLNVVFLAYRWAKSRAQYLSLHPLWWPALTGKATLRSTAVVAGEYARYLTGLAVLYGISALAGNPPEKDPRSKLFGKLQFGDTTLDPTSGLASWATFASQMWTGEKKTMGGEIMRIRDSEEGKAAFGQDAFGNLMNFLRGKLSPIVGSGVDLYSGRNIVGEPVTVGGELLELTTPLIFKDVYKAMQSNGVAEGTALSVLSFFGASIQTMDRDNTEKITQDDRKWLYNHALTVPRMSQDASAGSIMGIRAEDNPKLRKALSDDDRDAVLKASAPAVQDAVKRVREAVNGKQLDDKQAARVLKSAIEAARREALVKVRPGLLE